MTCEVCKHDFKAAELASIKRRDQDTIFVGVRCPRCRQEYYTHNHFDGWIRVDQSADNQTTNGGAA